MARIAMQKALVTRIVGEDEAIEPMGANVAEYVKPQLGSLTTGPNISNTIDDIANEARRSITKNGLPGKILACYDLQDGYEDLAFVTSTEGAAEPQVEYEGPNGENLDQGGRPSVAVPVEQTGERLSKRVWGYISFDDEHQPEASRVK